jgi:hypothetical protein
LRECVEQIDLLDGKKDGQVTRHRGVMDCEACKRRILKTATVCVCIAARETTKAIRSTTPERRACGRAYRLAASPARAARG